MKFSHLVIKQIVLAGIFFVPSGCSTDPLPLSGQWRLVNYWAVWCSPCREEIPQLNALNHYEDITVFGVNYDGKLNEELRAQADALGIEFKVLVDDPSADLGVPRPNTLPTTLVINPNGLLLTTLKGPQTEAELLNTLRALGRSG